VKLVVEHVAFAGQAVQDVEPVPLAYVPLLQSVHVEPSRYLPAGQIICWQVDVPDFSKPVLQVNVDPEHVEFAGQAEQDVEPVPLAYVPLPQVVQDVAPGLLL
jgi:hypothetical protein